MNLISFLHQISPDALTGISAILLVILILFSFSFFKKDGLQTYIIVAFLACNIQVMKASVFFFSSEPIPLGTLTYGTISIAIAIISEFFGFKEAKKAIFLGFLANIIFNIIIITTLGSRPVDPSGLSDEMKFLGENHENMMSIFMIMPSILIASLAAYVSSEFMTAFLQSFLKRACKSKFLMLRTYFANTIGAFIDLMIMNYLAWFFLNPNPIGLKQIFLSYVLAAYPFRLFSGLISIPTMFFARLIMKKKKEKEDYNIDKSIHNEISEEKF